MARILLAEDDDSVRAFVRRALELDGHAVLAVEDGSIALETLESDAGGFDLLVSDIKMPIMDGIALALNSARDYPHLPILLMTGFADQRERAHGLEALIYDVIPKPFTLMALMEKVADALAGKPPEIVSLAAQADKEL